MSPGLCTSENVALSVTMENLRLPYWRVKQMIVPRMGAAGGPPLFLDREGGGDVLICAVCVCPGY